MTKVLALKNEMNRGRTNFNMPADHTIRITDYWLLGFVEGEGSFFVKRNRRLGLGFSITQAMIDKAVMIEIQKFLLTLASTSNFANPNEGKLVSLYYTESRKDSHHVKCLIRVENEEFILKVLIPFFDKLTFYSKKTMDYQDLRAIAIIKEKGLHHTEEGKALITKILSQMNQSRLSTTKNKSIVVDREGLLAEIDSLLAQSSIYETREGRKFNLKDQKFENRGRAGSCVAIISDDGTTLKEFSSQTDCAKELGVARHVVVHRLKSLHTRPFNYQGKFCTIRLLISSP